MFAFHETKRRRLCRTAFIAVCVAPTIATASWIATHWLPGRDRALGRQLSERLHAIVEVTNVEAPRPGVIRVATVDMSDQGSQQPLATLAGIQVQSTGNGRNISIAEAAIDALRVKWPAERLYEWSHRQPGGAYELYIQNLRLVLPENMLAGKPGDADAILVLRNVRMVIQRDAAGALTLAVGAEAPGDSSGHRVEAVLSAAAPGDGSSTSLVFKSDSGWIPTPVLRSAAPLLSNCGANARFRGLIEWTWTGSSARGVARGTLDRIDLAQLLPSGSAHSLEGIGGMEFTDLRWDEQRLLQAEGTLKAEHARISRSLVKELASPQGFRCHQASDGVPVEGDSASIAVDALALRFQLSEDGLTFWGDCPAELGMHESCIAVSGMQPLLLAPPIFNWPVGILVQTLSAPPTAWVPATRQAVDWASRLPLPRR